MGSAPSKLMREEQCRIIAGEEFDLNLFNALKDSNGFVTCAQLERIRDARNGLE